MKLKYLKKKKTIINSYLGSFSFNQKNNNTLFKRLHFDYPDKKNRKKLIQNFIDVLMNKKIQPVVTIKEQFDLMSVCFASDKSLKLNKTINIKY